MRRSAKRFPSGPVRAGSGGTTPAQSLQMSKNSFELATTRDSLHSAWATLLRKSRPSSRNTVGIDGISINDFARDSVANINKLSREIRDGSFCFSGLRPHLIKKPNGKDRLICIPTVRDRIVQRALLEFLSNKHQEKLANDVSYGFVKNRNVKIAATLACNLRKDNPWVFKTDISSFFDTVDRKLLAQAISRHIRDKSLHKILLEAMSTEVLYSSNQELERIHRLGIKEGRGVRQGMPLSPIFANILLLQFDEAIKQKNYKCVRYADDLIFFAKSAEECKTICQFCYIELGKLNLMIPTIESNTKSVIYEPDQPAEFLGLGLCLEKDRYVLKLMPKQIDSIRDSLLKMGSIKELLNRNIKLANLGQSIESRISGYIYAYVDCVNADELEHELANIQQKVLKKIYTDGLHIDINKLPKEARTFLGLL